MFMKKISFILASLLVLFSCETNNNPDESNKESDCSAITLGTEEIMTFNAVLKGKAYFPSTIYSDLVVGFLFSTSSGILPSNSTMVEASDADADYNYTAFLTGLKPETKYYYRAFLRMKDQVYYGDTKEFTTLGAFVDMGLKMTRTDGTTYILYWAASNLSQKGLCEKAEDFGDYYAWGELFPKSEYSWHSYMWSGDTAYSLTKYNQDSTYGKVDKLTELEKNDDVARGILGPKKRIPTGKELNTLVTECKWSWTSVNGVNCRKATGPNGNSIFFPAAGLFVESTPFKAGSRGYYWSSSLDAKTYACSMIFDSQWCSYESMSRCEGGSIRPVTE